MHSYQMNTNCLHFSACSEPSNWNGFPTPKNKLLYSPYVEEENEDRQPAWKVDGK